MTSAFKCSTEKLIQYFFCRFVIDEPSWQNKNICIIVLPYHMSNFLCPCETGSYTFMSIECHTHTLTATAYSYSWIYLTVNNSVSKSMSEIGIVTTHITVCAIILVWNMMFLKILHHKFF